MILDFLYRNRVSDLPFKEREKVKRFWQKEMMQIQNTSKRIIVQKNTKDTASEVF